ncbi:M14 family zinc carboxypeptidase [Pseudoneobacillus sp. C159]
MRVLFLFSFTIVISFLLFSASTEASTIVDTTNTYSYEEMVEDIKALKSSYPEIITYQSIGKSEFQRDIYAVKVGKGEETVFINGSHHAREWLTTILIMEMIEHYSKSYYANALVGNFYAKDMLDEISLVFVPMVNPDGVTLQQRGLKAFPKSHHPKLLAMNDGKSDFTRWKANAMGIDLNRQYPANWNSPSTPSKPYYMGYKGSRPFQAKEVIALRDFTYKMKPKISVAYHTSGRILYWHFHNKNVDRDYRLAKMFSNTTGYRLVAPVANPTGKGYTDWFIQEFGLPAFTPELSYSVGERHVPVLVFPEEWRRNETIGLWLLAESYRLKYPTKIIRPFEENVALGETVYVYDQPSFLTRKNEKLTQQQYIRTLENERNWYHIETTVGNKWVYLPYKLATFPERVYLDIPKDHWAYTSTKNNNERGWINGVTATHFGANNGLTREQLAVILVRALKLPISTPEQPSFTDVSTNHWAYSYIETAKANGILNGVAPLTFGKGKTVTREQIAVIIARISGKTPTTLDSSFTDVAPTHWAYPEITLMKELGIFQGINGAFHTGQKLTRTQLSDVLDKINQQYPEFFE